MCTQEFNDKSVLIRHVQTKHKDWKDSTFYKEFMERVQAGKIGPRDTQQSMAYKTKTDISDTQDASEEAEASTESSDSNEDTTSDEQAESLEEPAEQTENSTDVDEPEEGEQVVEDQPQKRRRRSK